MRRYAKETQVPADRSRAEIEKLLTDYGADQFLYGWNEGTAVIGFRYNGRAIRFHLPGPKHEEYLKTPQGWERSAGAIDVMMAQEKRRRWRALVLVIKAKLEACSTGIATFESEFLAYTVLPNGQTVGEWVEPQLVDAYKEDTMPLGLLPEWKGSKKK